MTPLTARKRAFGSERLAAGQFCWLYDLWRQPQPATLVDFRGSSLSDAGSIPAISTQTPRDCGVFVRHYRIPCYTYD